MIGGKVTMTLIEALERENLKPEIPEFNVGDTTYNLLIFSLADGYFVAYFPNNVCL